MLSLTNLTLKDSAKAIGVWTLILLLIGGEVTQIDAGCQRFGHSCFGAHGKRAESSGAEMQEASAGTEYYPGPNTNRMSPYLMDLLMSVHRGQQRQLPPLPILNMNYGRAPVQLQDDMVFDDRRKK